MAAKPRLVYLNNGEKAELIASGCASAIERFFVRPPVEQRTVRWHLRSHLQSTQPSRHCSGRPTAAWPPSFPLPSMYLGFRLIDFRSTATERLSHNPYASKRA